jgi:hypothetical protein
LPVAGRLLSGGRLQVTGDFQQATCNLPLAMKREEVR